MNENELSNIIIGIAIEVHQSLGPGLLESAYKECLFYKLQKEGILVEKEKPMPLVYEEVKLECGYRIDILVEDKILIEVKAVDKILPVHEAQVISIVILIITISLMAWRTRWVKKGEAEETGEKPTA